MNTNNINQITKEFSNDVNSYMESFSEILKLAVNNFQAEVEHEIKNQNGITLDYKTYTELVNTLSYGTSVGTVDKGFYNKILNIGQTQECIKKRSDVDENMDKLVNYIQNARLMNNLNKLNSGGYQNRIF